MSACLSVLFVHLSNVVQQYPSKWSFLTCVCDHTSTNISDDVAGSFRWANGTYGDWWTPETTEEYDKRAGCFRDYFSTLKAGPYLIDGIETSVSQIDMPQFNKFSRVSVFRVQANKTGVSAVVMLLGKCLGF